MNDRVEITSRLVLLALILGMGPGCARPVRTPLGPNDLPQAFSRSGHEPLREKWWQAFGDDDLDALVERALGDNLELQAAWDRLAQAQALADRTGAERQVQVDGRVGAGRTRRDAGDVVAYNSTYLAGVSAGYEVDLWGQLKSLERAARLDAQGQREAVDTAAITLSALVAHTWYQLAEAQAQVRIAEEQIRTNRKVLDAVTVRFRKNAVSALDVLRQRQLVASTESRLIAARERTEVLQYILSVLVGAPPALAWEQFSIALPELPPAPASGIPAQVLWRRPDVRRAYLQVQAADERLAVAIADRYPRLSLSAGVETSGVHLRDLFDDWLANLAANAFQPLLDAGLRQAEVRRREALISEAIHLWRQTMLEALEEIETALLQEHRQAEFLASLSIQIDLARQTYASAQDRYTKGQTEYLRVLESLQSLQALERELVQARRILIERRIDVYRAIAGGWELPNRHLAESKGGPSKTAGARRMDQDG